MAERRMFSKQITDSDSFISMSSSTQALYFHLNQAADDDGFNNQIQLAMSKAHASVDDLKILLMKRFIIQFESGVIVIKHWRMHNTLRKDRYTPTAFQEEFSQLNIKDNRAYTLQNDDVGCQVVAERLPSGCPSIGKVSIGKVRVGNEESTADEPPEAEPPKTEKIPYDEIKNLYLTICVSYPRVQTLSANRKKAIHARWVQYHNIETFQRLFEKAEASDFLKGKNGRNWSATFDWLLNDANMAKTLEGNYDNKPGGGGTSPEPQHYSPGFLEET